MTVDEQKAINTIINYSVQKGYKVFMDIDQHRDHKKGNYYPQVQIDVIGKDLPDLCFFFGVENGEKLNYSSIFFIAEEDIKEAYRMKQEFHAWEQKAYQYIIVNSEDEYSIHFNSEIDPRDMSTELLDEIFSFLKSEYIERIHEIEE